LKTEKRDAGCIYRLAGEDAPMEATEAIAWVCRSVEGNARILKDAGRLKKILDLHPKELCRLQSRKQEVLSGIQRHLEEQDV
jgi:hypothetical protein